MKAAQTLQSSIAGKVGQQETNKIWKDVDFSLDDKKEAITKFYLEKDDFIFKYMDMDIKDIWREELDIFEQAYKKM